jgi:hypothetical protein
VEQAQAADINGAFERDYRYLSNEERALLLSLKEAGRMEASRLRQQVPLPEEQTERLLFTLEQSCYIKPVNGGYTLANEFFRRWLEQKAGRPLQAIPSTVSTPALLHAAEQKETTPVSRQTMYEDLVLLFTVGSGDGKAYEVRVIESPAGEAVGALELDPEAAQVQDWLGWIERRRADRDLFRAFGETLFRAVFREQVEAVYRASEGQAWEKDHGLRLRLRIEPPELSVLPWELLYDPLRERFLARSPRTPVSHYLPLPRPLSPLAVRPPLRLLLVISAPQDLRQRGLAELDADKEKERIFKALHDWEQAGLVEIKATDHAIVPEVHDQLRRFQPHVLHYIGHGYFDEKEERAYLVDEGQNCKFADERMVSELLGDGTTRLVVLNACETAATSSAQALTGMAPRLVQVGVPAVVAMRYPIADAAAITFSREFYRALSTGFAVDAAAADARKGLFLEWGEGNRAWLTPVVFMRTPDGRIFEVAD